MSLILTATMVTVLASLSPGPDILLTVLNSLRHGFRIGFATTLGILSGVSLHLTLGILGISYLITHNPQTMLIVSLGGGTWLLVLGTRGLRAAFKPRTNAQSVPCSTARPDASFKSAWAQGFTVNLLNAKAFLFFLSLFSVIIGPEVPLVDRILCAIAILVGQGCAFSLVAFSVGHPRFRNSWQSLQAVLEVLVSILLCGLGIWIWFETLKF